MPPPHETNVLLGQNLRSIRLLRAVSQRTLAEDMEVRGHPKWTQATVSRVERGRQPLQAAELPDLADALDVTLVTLFAARLDVLPAGL